MKHSLAYIQKYQISFSGHTVKLLCRHLILLRVCVLKQINLDVSYIVHFVKSDVAGDITCYYDRCTHTLSVSHFIILFTFVAVGSDIIQVTDYIKHL
jgi:hypothetical protein